jgi:hypothetical protein
MLKPVYMVVTNDKYELPVLVADSIAELARMAGVKPSLISSAICHAKKKGHKSIYVRVSMQ